jgi:hypothetical protein
MRGGSLGAAQQLKQPADSSLQCRVQMRKTEKGVITVTAGVGVLDPNLHII